MNHKFLQHQGSALRLQAFKFPSSSPSARSGFGQEPFDLSLSVK
jgi:hypothetical protein